ncbi:hypothetical protein BJ508DRAFT_322868 [Ascobolus immersus RN42]|uniref:Uncharacterized protein n=1 Tax=Ascobolus immersus RN42 TaxID=1160509 RepID=A0A3N4ILN7_ASCIM|nr:hypothetical protein BJ508DRAFT_322868 [Ascobolus immersus RN42]
MYNHPPAGVRGYAGIPDEFILEDLLEKFDKYSLDDYLHPITMDVCMKAMSEANYPIRFTLEDENGGDLPALEKPIGAMDWLEAQQLEKIERERERALQEEVGTYFHLYETDDDEKGKYDYYNGENRTDGGESLVYELESEVILHEDGADDRIGMDDDGIVYYV